MSKTNNNPSTSAQLLYIILLLKLKIKKQNYNNKYWKNNPEFLFSVLLDTLLGDVCMYKRDINVKFEQSLKYKEYLFHLYNLFELYIFSSSYEIKNKDGKLFI